MRGQNTLVRSNTPAAADKHVPVPVRIALGAVFVAFAAQAFSMWGYAIDDVYISYRYAAHLAEGNGLVWNLTGPPVEGFSNLLWVLILATAWRIGPDVVVASKILGFLCGAGALALLAVVSRRVNAGTALWWLPVALMAVNPVWIMWGMSGLELALFGLFLLSIVHGFTLDGGSRLTWIAVGVSGLTLTRPEGTVLSLVALVILCLDPGVRQGTAAASRPCLWPAAALFVTIAGMTLFRLLYFDALLPNTVYAKFTGRLRSLDRVLEWVLFGIPFFTAWIVALRRRGTTRIPLALWASLGLVVAQMLVVLPASPIMYFLHRYQIALFPLLALAVPRAMEPLARKSRLLAAGVVVLLALWTAQDWPEVRRRVQANAVTEVKLRDVAARLRSLPGEPTIALLDAGRIPYWTELNTIDAWGLCDPEIARAGFSPQEILRRAPEVYLLTVYTRDDGSLHPFAGADNIMLQSAEFRHRYGLWMVIPARPGEDVWGYGYAILLSYEWAGAHDIPVEPVRIGSG